MSGPPPVPPPSTDPQPARQVTLVLCTSDGTVLGALPSYDVDLPYWQEVADVVTEAKTRFDLDVTVLRLLTTDRPGSAHGGPVSYLAEAAEPPEQALVSWPTDPTAEHPLRQSWARPGGPAADIDWADGELARLGLPRTGPAQQVRTWNLSSLWRLPTFTGAAWLKVVPPFFAHEGAVLARLNPAVGPPLLAADGPRLLLAEVPGQDQYAAPLARLLPMVRMLVAVQVAWSARVGELLALGLPDWRPIPLAAAAADVVARTAHELPRDTVGRLESLVAALPERYDEVARCAVPDSLVHGDFHPGNVRGTDDRLVLLDWGDSGVGCPLLDQAAFLEGVSDADRGVLQAEWARLWRAAVPGCAPERAAHLLAPVAALRQAVIYRKFLDAVEPDERVYHARDPARWLHLAAEAADRD